MKKIQVLFMAMVITTLALAQEAPAKMRGDKKQLTPEERANRQTEKITTSLGLSADQKTKVYAAALDKDRKLQEVRKKYPTEADRSKKKEEVRSIRKNFVNSMNGILTPEQQTKWKEQRKDKRKHMKGEQKSHPRKKQEEPTQQKPADPQADDNDDDENSDVDD